MGIKVLPGRCLIQLDTAPKKVGNIFLPDPTQGKPELKPQRGLVLMSGGDGWDTFGNPSSSRCKAGDVVHIAKWAGGEIPYGGGIVYAVRHEDILAIEGPGGWEPEEAAKDTIHAAMYSEIAE